MVKKMNSTVLKHNHHLIEFKGGGRIRTDKTIKLTIKEHAEIHKKYFEKYGHIEDKLAWQGLTHMIDKQELISKLISHKNKERWTSNDPKWISYREKVLQKFNSKGQKGKNNSHSKTFKLLIVAINKIIEIDSLKDWCNERGINYNTFFKGITTNKTYKGFTLLERKLNIK